MRLRRLFKSALARESADWVAQGIITDSQAENICHQYGVDYHQSKDRSVGYAVLIGLGYLFIALAVITLIGANWNEIPRGIRMAALVSMTLAVQSVALFKCRTGAQDSARNLFLLGNFFYGASIILISQIYHLGEHMPDGVFWWALGCLPVAIVLVNTWLMLQTLLLATIWFFLETGMGFYPTLFPLFLLAAIYVVIRGRQNTLLFFMSTIGIALWLNYSAAAYWGGSRSLEFGAEHLPINFGVLLLAFSFSFWLSRRKETAFRDYGETLQIWSLALATIALIVLSYDFVWRELLSANWDNLVSSFVTLTLLIAVSLFFAYRTKKIVPITSAAVILFTVLAALLISGQPAHAVYFQILSNILFVVWSIGMIMKGVHDGDSQRFFIGVSSILIVALLRYFDLVGNYVGGALLFLLFAVLLLGAARYWKQFGSKKDAT